MHAVPDERLIDANFCVVCFFAREVQQKVQKSYGQQEPSVSKFDKFPCPRFDRTILSLATTINDYQTVEDPNDCVNRAVQNG